MDTVEERRLANIVELVRDESTPYRDELIEELLKDEESMKLLFENNKEVAKMLVGVALKMSSADAQRMRSFIMVNSREFLPLIAKKMKLAPVGPLGKPVFPPRPLYQPFAPSPRRPTTAPKVSSPVKSPKVSSPVKSPKVASPKVSSPKVASPKVSSPKDEKEKKEKKRYRRGQPCPEGKERNPKTNRCRKALKPCPAGKVRNPKTNRCKKT